MVDAADTFAYSIVSGMRIGRGWAIITDGQLQGRLYCHEGDESGFTATKDLYMERRKSSSKLAGNRSVIRFIRVPWNSQLVEVKFRANVAPGSYIGDTPDQISG